MARYPEWGRTRWGGLADHTRAPPVDVSERTGRERHIITGRDLATYVRLNASQQPYLVAAHILQAQGPPLDDGVPTNDNVPDSFIDWERQVGS